MTEPDVLIFIIMVCVGCQPLGQRGSQNQFNGVTSENLQVAVLNAGTRHYALHLSKLADARSESAAGCLA